MFIFDRKSFRISGYKQFTINEVGIYSIIRGQITVPQITLYTYLRCIWPVFSYIIHFNILVWRFILEFEMCAAWAMPGYRSLCGQ